jgi:hypothetical protein
MAGHRDDAARAACQFRCVSAPRLKGMRSASPSSAVAPMMAEAVPVSVT